jgi:acyl-CoA thioesterase-1
MPADIPALGRLIACAIWLILATIYSGPACAAAVVAIGASNTYGEGVRRGSDFPAQLEVLLKEKGFAVKVKNAGISGATTGRMLKELENFLDDDTRVVIFQPGSNDKRKGFEEHTKDHIHKIEHKLRKRGIETVYLSSKEIRKYPHADKHHLTPEGYRMLAEALLPQVMSALRK